MPYLLNTDEDRENMLRTIGVQSLDELFESIPQDLRLNRPLDIPAAMSELELTAHMQSLAAQNDGSSSKLCFLGAGSYDHFIPAVVDHIASRGEFYTSYTPYQPEVSQGNLQAMFEYQTLITQLTGMDVSNASLYDGGSAAVEGVLMALSVGRNRRKVVTLSSVHPEYRQILDTYFTNLDAQLETLDASSGVIDPNDLLASVDDETACVLVQQPNFFGSLEEMERIAEITHAHGALLVVIVDPISLGLLKRPGDYGADIVVAEGQSLGCPISFGGPYLGIMACREKFVRRMPGRIAGETVDRHGARCWVLTLQTREQHIRREKATSNICTNQGLFALRASLYLAAVGPRGLREVAELCLQKSHYAANELLSSDRFQLKFSTPFFKEFVVRDTRNQVNSLISKAYAKGIFAGIPLGPWYPELSDCFLVSVTEKRTVTHIDQLVKTLQNSSRQATVAHA